MKCFCGFLIPVTYLVAAFLTFAWIQDGATSDRDFAAGPGALFGGMFWPIYWGGVGSLKTVRLAKAAPSQMMCRDSAGNVWKPTADGFCVAR